MYSGSNMSFGTAAPPPPPQAPPAQENLIQKLYDDLFGKIAKSGEERSVAVVPAARKTEDGESNGSLNM